MNDKDIFDAVTQDLADRTDWANRQTVFYQLRHDGLRRRRKPFPGAADLHFPLVDQTIEKLKPFYYNQIFATELLASFVAKPGADKAAITAAAEWFDYKLKERSNFEDEILLAVDAMLQSGRGPLKIAWDAAGKRLRFEAVEPTYFIVPAYCAELAETDRATHVQHLSVWQYRNGPLKDRLNQDPDFIKRITGRGTTRGGESALLEQERASREGLTYAEDKNTIVLWEVYERTASGWMVHTLSPLAPDEEVRTPFSLPYRHGQLPFVSFQMERKARRYYDSRGVAEILAAFETYLCKTWNEKSDSMTYFNRPLLMSEQQIPNPSNLAWEPGTILPFKVGRVDLGAPPMSFEDEMLTTRSIAEQRMSMPDFGVGRQDNLSGRKTATEVDAISTTANTVIDMRSRLSRRQLKAVYDQCWSLLGQYDEDVQYLAKGEQRAIDVASRDLIVSIAPAGSSASWDRQGQLQKAISRKQLFAGAPWINQVELDKSILELDEPGLIDRLVQDPGSRQHEQAGLQMQEIPALLLGMPVPINDSDDDATHAQTIIAFNVQMAKQGGGNPQAMQAVDQHFNEHIQRLEQRDPKQAGAVMAAAAEAASANSTRGHGETGTSQTRRERVPTSCSGGL